MRTLKLLGVLLLIMGYGEACAPNDADRPMVPPSKVQPNTPKASKERVNLPVAQVVFRFDNDRSVEVRADIAETSETRRVGLMYRKSLPPNGGMLFVFPTTAIQAFWMKNTLIPLDMIFLSETYEVVGIVREATPHSLVPRSVSRPCRYVLEVNGGWAKQQGLKVGQRAEVKRL